jgi:hypothetical protein
MADPEEIITELVVALEFELPKVAASKVISQPGLIKVSSRPARVGPTMTAKDT